MTTTSKNRNVAKGAPLPPRGTLDPELQKALASKSTDTSWNDDLSQLPPLPSKDETLVVMSAGKK